MATLKQYWTDEVARITTALSAQQSALTLLRGTLMSAETGQRNTAQAISAHSAELTAARSALAGIPMPADSDPLVKKMKQALVALRQAQAGLATGELRVQQLRAEFARAQTQEASLKAALTDAKNTLAEEEVHSKARADLGTALSSGDPSTLVAAATAALAAHKVTALARVEDEFPSSGTDARSMTCGTCRYAPPPERNASKLSPVASSTLATLSVDGQRSRPSLLTRLDLLYAVASRPASRASAEAERPCRSATASMAFQMSLCETMRRQPAP